MPDEEIETKYYNERTERKNGARSIVIKPMLVLAVLGLLQSILWALLLTVMACYKAPYGLLKLRIYALFSNNLVLRQKRILENVVVLMINLGTLSTEISSKCCTSGLLRPVLSPFGL